MTVEVLQADNLIGLTGIRHGFFTRDAGLRAGKSSENRRRVSESLGVAPDRLLSCRQIHSPDVVTVVEPWRESDGPEADGMVTKERGIALGVLTADCAPVLFVDSAAGVIGAAHAGWRGAISGILENTVKAMEDLGALRKNMRAAIGPCIWQTSYEVGPEFPAPFLAENPAHKKYFRPAFKSDRTMFDLPGYVRGKLHDLGVPDVEPSPADTFADETRFFSYRRGPENAGRMIAAIVHHDRDGL
jgi:YfiH family protein